MKIKRCALAAAVVMAVCAVVLLCWNRSVPEAGTVVENSVAPIQAAVSAAPTTVAALAAPVAEPASNQTATVRGTKPYVLTCEENFNNSNRLAVEALGVKTVEVLSRKSLLVEADAAALARIKADRRFSVEREFLPSDKIAPRLAAQIAGGAGDVEVSVVTLSADDHRRVQDRVVARGGEILTGCINEGTTFRARMSASLISEFASFGDVRWMEAFNRPRPLNNLAVTNVAMNVQETWNVLGLSGAGQFVSTSDSGIDTGDKETMHADLKDQVAGIKVVEGCLDHDENGHGTHTAGSIVGTGAMWTNETGLVRGTAYGAQLYAWFCGRADGKLGMPTTMAELFRGNAEGSEWNAYIHSASWGSEKSNGEYDTQCVDVDRYVWEHPEFLPVFAAGNEGSGARTISSPAAAKNVLAVGATQNLREGHDGGWGNGDPKVTAKFSSRGPCQDGRTKPDIAAPGVGILSTRAFGVDYKTYGIYDDYYAYDSGTSMACPLTAGAVALVREWLISNSVAWKVEGEAEIPTAALMKAIVTGGAKDAARPNNDQGWGRLDLMETLAPSNRAVKLIDRIPFAAGEEFTWVVETTNAAPLDVQLAWIDFPGAAAGSQAAPRIVNDLDLTVRAFDGGDLLYGNGGSTADTLNTLESVRVESASPTKYFVTVSCQKVIYDHKDGGAAALYIRGAFDPETIEPYWTVRIVRPGAAETNTYIRLDKALADATDGDVIEILDKTELSGSVALTNDFALTLVATNADARLSPIVRRDHAVINVRKGSLFFTNVVFQTEATTPVTSEGGVVKVAGTAVFDDIVSRTPGILTTRPAGFVLAGELKNGITVDCSGASNTNDQFGVYSCSFEVASNSAPRIVSSLAVDRAGVAEAPDVLKWGGEEVPVDPEVAVAYVDNGSRSVYYRTLDRLFDEHLNGTNVVVTKSGLVLRKPRTLTGAQSISADADAGEIVVSPEGTAGFTVGTNCDLTVSGITFRDYTGNGLFVVDGENAKLTVTNSAFRNIKGTNKRSGAIAVLKGSVTSVNTDYDNCCVTGVSKSYGGAVYLDGPDCELELNGGTVKNCMAPNGGGGVYAASGAIVRVRGDLTVKGNSAPNVNKPRDDIGLAKGASLVLSGRLTSRNAVGVRYASGDPDTGFGNGISNFFATVEAEVSYSNAVSSAKAFFNDVPDPESVADVDGDPATKLLWVPRELDERWLDAADPDAKIKVMKVGEGPRYCAEPEYAFAWIDADATVELLDDVTFGGDLVVTNGVNVTLRSIGPGRFELRRRGELEISVRPGASLTVSNLVLNGNGSASTVGLVKVDGAALELQAGTTVTGVAGSADRASGAVAVRNGGTFTMRPGARIVNCRNSYENAGSNSGYGGGLLVEDDSTANLFGGSITGCAAKRGGGVFIGTRSHVFVSGDMCVTGNTNLVRFPSQADNLCVADLSALVLTNDFGGSIGYNEGRGGATNEFGRIAAGFSGDVQAAAQRFTHDVTGDFGLAVTNGTETLLVWGNALDPATGTYRDKDEKSYALVEGLKIEIQVPRGRTFTYDGTEKIGLEDDIGYVVVSGNVATVTTNHLAVIRSRPGFEFGNDVTETNVLWTINPAAFDLAKQTDVKFKSCTNTYDGTLKYLYISGTLPDWLKVSYPTNGFYELGVHEIVAVIEGKNPNYTPNPYRTELHANLVIVDGQGWYPGKDDPQPLPFTVTTNDPSMTPLAFSNIVRIAGNEWQLSLTNLLQDAEYALSFTADLTTPFTTGQWFKAEVGGLWTTNWIFTAEPPKPAYFWRAHGRTTYVTNWIPLEVAVPNP